MKILHILSTPRAEGTPRLVLDWLGTELTQQEVFVLNASPPDLAECFRNGAAWYAERHYFSLGKGKFFAISAGVREVCLERQPDIVICWPTGFANWVCLGARLAGTPRLLVHCGNPPTRSAWGDWITRYVMWPLRLLGAHCVCCSDYVRDQFRAVPLVPGNLFSTVHNCAKIGEFADRAAMACKKRLRSAGPAGIMVATMERHKDHRTLLEAMPFVLEHFPGFQLRMVGDGSLREELEFLASQLGLAPSVSFLGTRQDVPELLGESDLFVFSTTEQEGLGSVLIEALAAGLPVVATAVPACLEVLDGGRLGEMVPPASPQALAQGICKALASLPHNPQPGIEWASRFTPQAMIEGYLRL